MRHVAPLISVVVDENFQNRVARFVELSARDACRRTELRLTDERRTEDDTPHRLADCMFKEAESQQNENIVQCQKVIKRSWLILSRL